MTNGQPKIQHHVSLFVITFLISLGLLSLITAQDLIEERRANFLARAEKSVATVDADLLRLKDFLLQQNRLSIECDQSVIQTLRQGLVDLFFVTEFGLIDQDNKLRCTSWEKVEPPPLVPRTPAGERFKVVGPIEVLLGKPMLILQMSRSDGSQINALIPFTWLKHELESFAVTEGFGAFLDPETGVPIAITSRYTLPLPENQVENIFPLAKYYEYEGEMDDTSQRLLVMHRLQDWPLALAFSMPTNLLYQGVYRITLSNVLVSLLIAAVTAMIWFFATKQKPRSLSQRIAQGIKLNEFVNYYQPIVDARSNHVVALEVLVRWDHPVDGMLPPNVFIPEAERDGLIIPMTFRILENAISDLRRFFVGGRSFNVNINICGQHLMSPDFVDAVVEAKKSIPNLVLELTENEVIDAEDDKVVESLNHLRSNNILLAIDDFGTGYCGLKYLDDLPIDTIKIDRAFVAACGTDSPGAEVLSTVAELASRLKIKVVAEGVETQAQADYLTERGIYDHQGWHYAKAMPIFELAEYLHK